MTTCPAHLGRGRGVLGYLLLACYVSLRLSWASAVQLLGFDHDGGILAQLGLGSCGLGPRTPGRMPTPSRGLHGLDPTQQSCIFGSKATSRNKRCTKIHKLLLSFGKWTQSSLFDCFLSRKELILLRSKLAEHLVAKEDSVRFYPLCASCVSRVETVGGPAPSETSVFLV